MVTRVAKCASKRRVSMPLGSATRSRLSMWPQSHKKHFTYYTPRCDHVDFIVLLLYLQASWEYGLCCCVSILWWVHRYSSAVNSLCWFARAFCWKHSRGKIGLYQCSTIWRVLIMWIPNIGHRPWKFGFVKWSSFSWWEQFPRHAFTVIWPSQWTER